MKIVTLENLAQFKSLLMTYINRPHDDNEWLKTVYPVGSIYMSTSATEPNTLFGFGTWQRIKDVFLLTAGDVYSANSTGGEASHTLTVDEMPQHSHIYKRHAFDRNDSDPETGEDVYGANNKTLGAHMGTTEMSGGNQPHNNMPPYLTVYAWQRVE